MDKVVAISSGGGHWTELMLLQETFGESVHYVTTDKDLPISKNISRYSIVTDANKEKPFKLVLMFFQLFLVYINVRPKVIISTGAAPGVVFLLIGKVFRSKTIWVDSLANADELSLAGKIASRFCDHTFTQWSELESKSVKYIGRVL